MATPAAAIKGVGIFVEREEKLKCTLTKTLEQRKTLSEFFYRLKTDTQSIEKKTADLENKFKKIKASKESEPEKSADKQAILIQLREAQQTFIKLEAQLLKVAELGALLLNREKATRKQLSEL